MPRTVSLRCHDCARSFGGHEGERKHKAIRGDRLVCMTDRELLEKGWTRDRAYVWHRPVGSTAKAGSALVRPSLFDVGDTDPVRLARTSDPTTSARAARSIKTGSLKALLLAVYFDAPEGLTDEEAALRAGVSLYSATKRCADLRNDGLIVAFDERKGSSGLARQVCRVAEAVSA